MLAMSFWCRFFVLSWVLFYCSGQGEPEGISLLQIQAAKVDRRVGRIADPTEDSHWTESGPEDLIDQFNNIFPTGNRNAASYKWAQFLFNHSMALPIASFDAMQHSYCAISGSPIDPVDGEDGNAYRVTLQSVAGQQVTGLVRHCCWPCLCDLRDLVRVDTQDVTTADGTYQRQFLVINDPCTNTDCLTAPFQGFDSIGTVGEEAPELTCAGNKFADAVRSDSDRVIIGPFIEDDGRFAQEASWFDSNCVARANDGFESGMGQLFRAVAQCNAF